MCTETKEVESSTGRVWAVGFHHVTARSLFIYLIFNFLGGAADSVSAVSVTRSLPRPEKKYINARTSVPKYERYLHTHTHTHIHIYIYIYIYNTMNT
jgi:hypothetical protein